MSEQEIYAFMALVFTAVFLLTQSLVLPVFGERRLMRRRINQRLNALGRIHGEGNLQSLLRQKYLRQLSPLERQLESLPGMERLSRLLDQAGLNWRAYRVVLLSLSLALAGGLISAWYWPSLWLALAVGAALAWLPLIVVLYQQGKRMNRFEEQLPDALDCMCRALRAGHPFSEALHLVSNELNGPVAEEFALTFADLNYGNDIRHAMLGQLQRIPSPTVMMLVTGVLVHRDTGGNLTEILDRLAQLIRARFRFQRRIRTLSAEGRLSAWVLTLVPFALFLVMMSTSPTYLPIMLSDSTGQRMIVYAALAMLLGMFWIRKVIRVDV